VLAQLYRRPPGMTPGELTRELLVTAGNVTGIVDRLARRRLVERRPVPEDRRAVRVRLTSRGHRVMEQAIPRHRRDLELVLAPVSAPDLTRLREALRCLIHALDGQA
jgi:DNA-binding MarR family transcriptional regulator